MSPSQWDFFTDHKSQKRKDIDISSNYLIVCIVTNVSRMATLIAVIRTIIDEMIAVLIGSHITTGVTVGPE